MLRRVAESCIIAGNDSNITSSSDTKTSLGPRVTIGLSGLAKSLGLVITHSLKNF